MPAYGVDNGVHPDHHAWWIHPKDGSFMIDGNDGGLNITKDKGKTWRFAGNIPVAQFYHINVDNDFPYNVYGGMQDNGSWGGPAYVWKAQGIRNSYWQELAFGDGFDVVPDKEDSRYGYAMSQQGSVARYDQKTGYSYSIKPTHPDPKVKLRFNWNSAIGQDPFDNSTIYFGSQFVHKSTDKGTTWNVISPDLSTNDPNKQKQSESGGLSMDATGAENHTTILVIEPSTLEKDMLWVGTDDGNVQVTKNGGASWTNVTKNIKDLPKGSWIAQIKASNKNKGEALLIANDYRRFNYTPYAYRTKNYGKTWTRIVDANDVKSYTLSIVEDLVNPNLLFLGTDDGLYISLNAGEKWTKWTNGFPTVPVKDLVIHPREHDLVIGTFGRAAWVLDDIKPLRALAKGNKSFASRLQLFEPPVAYQASFIQPTGSRFGADALYQGENRKRGAPITFYINKPAKKKPIAKKKSRKKSKNDLKKTVAEKNKVKWDSIKLEIFDGTRLIRTLKQKAPKENGIHTMRWYLREKGVARASRRIRKSRREPSGLSVKPGTYKLKMSFGNVVSEQNIKVEFDPRLTYSKAALSTRYQMSKQLEANSKTIADIVKQLVESKNTASDFSKKLAKADKKKYKSQIKASKDISKKIEKLISGYLGTIDKRQGITRNPEVTVNQRLGLARRYLGARFGKITKTETELINNFRDALKEALTKANNFFTTDWKKYKSEVESISISPFKEVKTF